MRPLPTAALAAFSLLVLTAAGDAPLMTPSRDVDVTYTITAPVSATTPARPSLTERMRWDTAGGRYRVDPPTPGMWMVVDEHAHTMTVMREAEHEALVMPRSATSHAGPGAASGRTYERRGTDTVAGQPCTVWRTTDDRGTEVLSCITADGVLLRASVGGHTVIEAKSVAYGPEPASVFAVPEGFRVAHPPVMPSPHAP